MYQSLEASFHDLFWRAEPEADESALLKAFLNEHPGKALEVGCGSGRFLLPLLQGGYDLEGVEISEDMLELLHAEAKHLKLEATVYLGDASRVKTGQRYNAFLIPAFTLQLLSRVSALACLKRLRAQAKNKAGLYLTTFIPWAEIVGDLELETWYTDKETTTADGQIARCETRFTIDRLQQQLDREHRYSLLDSNGKCLKSHSSEQSIQWYHLPELELMLESAGWRLSNVITDFDAEGDVDSDAQIMTLHATAV